MSALVTALYPALAAINVSVRSSVVPVYGVGIASPPPLSVHTSMLPCRILLPLDDSQKPSVTTFLRLRGKSAQTTWQIVDLMLLAATGQGGGLPEYAIELERYRVAYLEAIRAAEAELSTRAPITSVTTAPGVFEYGGTSFFGVLCTPTIVESH